MLNLLPQKLYLQGSRDDMLNTLYNIFKSDIKNSKLRYNGFPVYCDDTIKADDIYENGFWHLITQEYERKHVHFKKRKLDYQRAKRLPWLKPIIENSGHTDILKWLEEDITRKGELVEKTHFWYRNGQYLIVLTKRRCGYYIATAFYVYANKTSYYQGKYSNAKKKGPEC